MGALLLPSIVELFNIYFRERQRIDIPFSVAKDIIGSACETIDHICWTSGLIISIEENKSLPEKYILEVRGTTLQLLTSQQLIEVDFNNFIVSLQVRTPYFWTVFLLGESFVFCRPKHNISSDLVVRGGM